MDWLEEQMYWKRNNGWDHVFICQDPNALYKVIDRVKNGVLLVSDFGRLAHNQASLVKDVILPYSHRINTYKGDAGLENRKSLLFFMGNRYRKEVMVCLCIVGSLGGFVDCYSFVHQILHSLVMLNVVS